MKTFRLIGIAIMAILMSVNFTSCSSDDEEEELIKNDDGIITNQKRLVQIKVVDDFQPATWDFSYDSKGRLIALNEAGTDFGSTYRDATDYTWGANIIIAETEHTWGAIADTDNYKETYSLDKNLVRSVRCTTGRNTTSTMFTYNSDNQVIKIEENKNNTTESYTWQGEKMTKLTYKDEAEDYEDVYEYTYSGKNCKGYFPLFNPDDPNDIDGLLFYAHPELMGVHSSQLPDQVYNKHNDHEHIYKYTYTFDKDGYVESCTVIGEHPSENTTNTYTTIYTFTWE